MKRRSKGRWINPSTPAIAARNKRVLLHKVRLLLGLAQPFSHPGAYKYLRNHVRYQRTNYTVFPLGWRGVHHWGGQHKRGVVVECPKCGRRGITVPGYRRQNPRYWEDPWLPTMIMHAYPPHEVSKMICCLFDTEDAPYQP